MYLSVQSSGYWFKKYEITTINLKTTNPYLPDRVEFKHQYTVYMRNFWKVIRKKKSSYRHRFQDVFVAKDLNRQTPNWAHNRESRKVTDRDPPHLHCK